MIDLKFVATIGNSSLAVTDVAATQSEAFEVIFGKCFKGDKGDAGATPVITSTKVGKTTTIYCDGVAIATIVDGNDGAPGAGFPSGGTTGKVLKKRSNTDYDTEWGEPEPDSYLKNATVSQSGTKLTLTKKDNSTVEFEGSIYDDTAVKNRLSTIEGKEDGWDAKYNKPSGGIPKSDLEQGVKASLDKADSSIQNVKTINNQSIVGTGNMTINPAPEIDNSSITKNNSQQLQAEGIVEKNAGNVLKKWVGTKAEYDALATHSNDTEYTITDDSTPMLYDVLVVDEMMIFGEHTGARIETETLIIG